MISGATSSSYVPPCTTVGINYYYCEVTNTIADYSASTLSSVAGIRVVPPPDHAKPPVITSDLSTTPVTYEKGNAAAPLRIGAIPPDGGVLTYQWYKLINGSGQALAGEIYATFTPDTVEVGESYYYCVVTNTLNETSSSVTSATAKIIVAADETKGLIRTIIDKIGDLFQSILNLPNLIIDGIKSLFIPDAASMAAYQDKWFALMSSRFGAIYESVVLIDEFGQAITAQTEQGIVTFPEVTLDLAGTPWTFGGWEVQVVPDGFGGVIIVLKSVINIVCTFAFVNSLRRRFEGVIGGA